MRMSWIATRGVLPGVASTGAPETIVVTSQGPIPKNATGFEEILLLDGSGNPIPQDISAEGAAETTPIEAIGVP
jgi:hypothetical protein